MNTIGTFLQDQRIISVREFMQSFSKINDQPTSKLYTVVKNGQKTGTYVPKQFEAEVFAPVWYTGQHKYNSLLANYDKIAFSTGDPDLSQKIDDIVYGEV